MFSDTLGAIRKSLGLSRKEFENAAGIARVTYWELGNSLPSSWSMRQIVDYFRNNNVDCTELIDQYRSQKEARHYRKSSGRTWNENYERLRKYLQEHGSYPPAPSELGIWVTNQRNSRRKQKLKSTEEHIRLLNGIHFQWEADRDREAQEWKEAVWQNNYDQVYENYLMTGHIPKSLWVRTQMKIPHTAEQQDKLDKLGIRLAPGKVIRERRKGISQKELAKVLGISAVTLHHWENGMVPEYLIWEILRIIEKIISQNDRRSLYFYRCRRQYTGIGNGRTVTVPRGTWVCPETTAYFRTLPAYRQREKMIAQGKIVNYMLQNDYEFSTPQIAASVLSGRGVFSSDVWHDREGHTWKEIWK